MNWLLQAAEPIVRKLYHGLPGGSADWSPSWLASAGMAPNRDGDPAPAQSLGESSVYAAVAALASPLAAAPRHLVREDLGGAVQRVSGTAASALLRDWSFESLEAGLLDALVAGNGFWHLQRDARGAPGRLQWLPAWRVQVAVDDGGAVWYEVSEDATAKEPRLVLPARDVVHLKYRPMARHRHLGVSPLATCAPSMGLVVQVRKGTTSLYRNVAAPSAILTHSKKLDPDEVKRVKARWVEATSGNNVGAPVVLHNGLAAQPFDIAKAVEMQSEELLKLSPQIVSRVYGVPPAMLGVVEGINYSSAAEASRTFVNQTLRPWARRIADCLDHALLSREDRNSGLRVQFDLSAMVRGEGQQLADMLSKLANGGIASPNECRAMLGLPPTDGGEVLRAPSNTYALDHWRGWDPSAEPEPPPAEPVERTLKVELHKMTDNQAESWMRYAPDPDDAAIPDAPTQAELLHELSEIGLSLEDLYQNGDLSPEDFAGLNP
mgnify:CR=1 FL=1